MKYLLVCLAIFLLPMGALAQPRVDSMVLTEKEAFLLLPPEVICQPQVMKMEWSPDGSYLLIFRLDVPMTTQALRQALTTGQPPKATASLLVWNSRSKRSVEVWQGDAQRYQLDDVGWFSKSPAALITMRERGAQNEESKAHLMRLDAAAGKVQTLFSADRDYFRDSSLSFSPTHDVAAYAYPVFEVGPAPLEMRGLTGFSVHIIRPAGVPSAAINIGSDPDTLIGFWTADAKVVYEATQIDRAKRTAKTSYKVVDPQTLKLEVLTEQPALWKPSPAIVSQIGISDTNHTVVARETKRNLRALWLFSVVASKFQHALVAAEADHYTLSSDLQHVAYRTQGVAIVRPLARLPRAEVEQAIIAAERNEIMSRGKQAALGLLMYAADNDDKVPGKDADLNELINPYLKNPDILKGFVYTFDGGSLTGIEKPAETVLGYIQGSGGKAIVYADGHVGWIDD